MLSPTVCLTPDCDRRAVLVCGRCRRVFCPRHTRPPEDEAGFRCAACAVAQPVPAGLPDERHRTPAGTWMKP